jgi:prepilin-type N-terminal cleavage/methylation domain-containing protein
MQGGTMKKIVKIIPEKSIKGFSLIEFVIVLLIASIIIVGVGEWYRIYTASRALKITEERIERVQEALTLYFAVKGRFPRPAVPSISFGNPEAGNERAITGVRRRR